MVHVLRSFQDKSRQQLGAGFKSPTLWLLDTLYVLSHCPALCSDTLHGLSPKLPISSPLISSRRPTGESDNPTGSSICYFICDKDTHHHVDLLSCFRTSLNSTGLATMSKVPIHHLLCSSCGPPSHPDVAPCESWWWLVVLSAKTHCGLLHVGTVEHDGNQELWWLWDEDSLFNPDNSPK